MNQIVRISDATLRDARNSPGVYFTVEEAVEVAQRLEALGVSEIEAGIADPRGREPEYLAAVAGLGLTASVSSLYFCLSRQTIAERIPMIVDLGCDAVCISIPTSAEFIEKKLNRSFRATCKLLEQAVTAARDAGLKVAFSGEDAARADVNQLRDYVKVGADHGAHRFRFAESVACLEPRQMEDRVGALVSLGIDIEVHCHSAYGLAVSNSIAAVQAGASWVSTTVGGIGERGGNTPIAPVLLYLHRFLNHTHFHLHGLKQLEDFVATLTGLPNHRLASIVGDDAFCYELANQYQVCELYEDYPPELVGNNRCLVLGYKCEQATIDRWSAELGINSEALRERIRRTVETERRPVRFEELQRTLRGERTT